MVPAIRSSETRDDGFKSRVSPLCYNSKYETRDFPSHLSSSLVLLLEAYLIFKLYNCERILENRQYTHNNTFVIKCI